MCELHIVGKYFGGETDALLRLKSPLISNTDERTSLLFLGLIGRYKSLKSPNPHYGKSEQRCHLL